MNSSGLGLYDVIQQLTKAIRNQVSASLPSAGVPWTMGHMHASEEKRKLATQSASGGVAIKPSGKNSSKTECFYSTKGLGRRKGGRIK